MPPLPECLSSPAAAGFPRLRPLPPPATTQIGGPAPTTWQAATGPRAFTRAWNDACKASSATLNVAGGKTFLVNNLYFQGPCQPGFTFQIVGITIQAPESSPNTDGIDTFQSTNIVIKDSTIGTGDDCVGIGDGSSNININDITCGPGHGISIGSLGRGNTKAYVHSIHVNGAKLTLTTNGLRIKTWPVIESGAFSARRSERERQVDCGGGLPPPHGVFRSLFLVRSALGL
ncbi:polygalacturonase-like [Cryptomeria japonica]|uniref:polygalacturonase-like n=1 Tax=Cryptomeria japonica TaxID=3369 RepID=UPI0027DAABA2|nr:polygalacturonase-like [Cryptomeria japonica]